MHTYPCLHCLASSSVVLKLDKKSRPYATCRTCGSRTFMHDRSALRGLLMFGQSIRQLWATAASGATTIEQADRAVTAAIEAGTVPYGASS